MAGWNTQEIFEEIIRRCVGNGDGAGGERVVLCTIVSTRGSCPQEAGAKMIVLGNGKTIGTLGGGCVEAEVRTRASQMLLEDRSGLLEFDLNHDYGWDDGMICGGVLEIQAQSLDVSRIEPFRKIVEKVARFESAELRLSYVKDGKDCEYVETIEPPPTLLIVGAGHVAKELCAVAGPIGFDVAVMDDRPDYVSEGRFPAARRRIAGDIEGELIKFPITESTYVVIVTRGHQHDGKALARVVDSRAKYVGMIGSKRKVKAIYEDLAELGVPAEKLLRVHAPIGYDIGAVTVPEIAVSIAAELVAIRRGATRESGARAMKMDEQQVRDWLSRKQPR